jgi:hypothetical protein
MSTINVQGRIDIKSLAMVARAYLERGSMFTCRSDLMGRIVDDASIAAERLGVDRPETDEAAFDYLKSVGINLASSDRGRREVRRALIRDVGVHDYYGEDLMQKRTTKRDMGNASIDYKEMYDTVANFQKAKGIVPVSFEKFMEGKKREDGLYTTNIPAEDTMNDTVVVDPKAYIEKEEKRMAAEKVAYSPEALRQALNPGA